MMKIRNYAWVALIVSALIFVVWQFLFFDDDNARLWYAFLFNFLFFTSAAGGLAVWPAIVVSTYGKWMGSAERFCYAGLSFSLPSLIALLVLWVGAKNWAPWIIDSNKEIFWLNNTFLFTRNVFALLGFWVMAFYFVKKRYAENNRTIARWFVLVFVLVFSLLGFDFVMALEPEWYSMMMGGYFFISAVYIGVAVWAFLVVLSGTHSVEKQHDLGKLLIAFCMFTTYLMFSQLFPIWYENMRHETVFLIPRMNYGWKWISYALLAMVYIGPIPLLLSARVKRSRLALGTISLMIIVGMWMERWWLVAAVFYPEAIVFGWEEILPSLAFLSLAVAGVLLSKNYVYGFVEPQKSVQ